jgi:hypothetical protein
MLIAIFVLTVTAVLVVHHLLVERPRGRAARETREWSGPDRPCAALSGVPAGVFLQPTCTWSRQNADGELLLGVQPLLASLVGYPQRLEVVARGRVGKGEPLIRIRREGRELLVRSPVSGVVRGTRNGVDAPTSWHGLSVRDSWVCRVEPENLDREAATWTAAAEARAWSAGRYGAMRDRLLELGADRELGTALADGGELPAGVVMRLDEAGWAAFEEEFLHG